MFPLFYGVDTFKAQRLPFTPPSSLGMSNLVLFCLAPQLKGEKGIGEGRMDPIALHNWLEGEAHGWLL